MEHTNRAIEEAYDELPYESFTYAQTHPPHLSAVAKLFGLKAPDVETARVLEIGCAGGGNLLPLALLYPDAHFTGLDISGEQIAAANRLKEQFGAQNIDFVQQDLMTFDLAAHKEKFDYIIAHGVLSWVPKMVGEKVMEVCRECLSPRGLAVISYNTLPGWNAVRSIREMMLHHTAHIADPMEKVKQARHLAELMAKLAPQPGHKETLQAACKLFAETPASYIYHDYLEDTNLQFYLHQVVGMLEKNELRYVGDSSVDSMFYSDLPQPAVEVLKQMKDRVTDMATREQYMDFATNRQFRTSIICKAWQKPDHDIQPDQIMDFHLTLAPDMEASSSDPSQPITFRHKDGGHFSTKDELMGTLLLELLACGRVPVEARTLVGRVQKRLNLSQPKQARDALTKNGMALVLRGFIRLHAAAAPNHAAEVSEKPVAFSYALHEARQPNIVIATNVMRQRVPVKGVEKQVLGMLDGSKTVEEIALHVMRGAGHGDDMRDAFITATRETLQTLARQGLLIG